MDEGNAGGIGVEVASSIQQDNDKEEGNASVAAGNAGVALNQDTGVDDNGVADNVVGNAVESLMVERNDRLVVPFYAHSSFSSSFCEPPSTTKESSERGREGTTRRGSVVYSPRAHQHNHPYRVLPSFDYHSISW